MHVLFQRRALHDLCKLNHFPFRFMIKVFEDVVEILDPEMNIDSETEDDGLQVKSLWCIICFVMKNCY